MSSNKKAVIDKPLWWKVLLVVLGTLYLIPEAIFNSQLVSLLGLGTPSKENLEHLELFGRSVSGIGVTLLFADFLKGKFINNIPKAILSFSVLLICTWSIVFYGQKYLVETFIIETSTAEQRQQAVYSSFLRDALSTDTIHINSVNYDSAYLDSPENLTFLALFGGLAYADASLAESLEDSKEKIIYNFVQKKAYNDFERHYSDYSQLYNELSSSYESYADGSYKYNNTILNIPQREAEYWIEVEQNINDGYNKYKEAQKSHIAKASGRAQEYGEDIFKYFEAVNKCRERYKKSKYIDRRNKCIEDKQIRYRKNIMKLGLGYIEPDYWLIPIKISTGENLLTSLIGGVLTGGLYTGMQAIDAVSGGDGGFKDVRYEYTSSPDHYQMRILQHPEYHKLFEKETGYPFSIQNLQEFREHEVTNKKLVNTFKRKGLMLNNKWNINQRDDFYNAVDAKVRLEARRNWDKEIRQRGFTMQPNLTWDEFQLHQEVQIKIKEKMEDNYVPNIRADWNKKNFKINVVDVNINKKTKEYLDAIKSALIHFEDGGKYEEYGKQALRSVIIPPISMFLSLFLICLTIAKLPAKYYSLFKHKESNIKNKWIKHSLTVLSKIYMPILILTIPVFFITNTYTQDKNNTVNYFLNKVNENTNFAVSYVIKWTIHTQPLLHPLGDNFEKLTGIYKSFDNISPLLHNIDIKFEKNNTLNKSKDTVSLNNINDSFLNKLINEGDNNKLNKYLSSIGKGLLYVNAPSGSKIQVMNIKPKYQEGMLLINGKYDIKVTYPDGTIRREWHSINSKKNIIQF